MAAEGGGARGRKDTAGSIGAWRGLLRLAGVDLRPGEGNVALLLFLCFFLFITFQYVTKSVRQSTFIDSRGAAELPWVYLSVALLSYPFLLLYSRLANRYLRHRLMSLTCAVIGASMLLCWWLFQFDWPWLAYAFYVWISLVYVMNVTQFWSFSSTVLDPRQAKRLFGFVGAGGLLGGVAGGQVASLVARVADTRSTFLVAAVLVLAAAALVHQVHRAHPALDEAPGASGLEKLETARGGLSTLRGSRHLQGIALIVVLTTVVAQIVDFQFNWAAEQATTTLDQRTEFFGNFFSIMGIAAFLFQLVFTARIHRLLGIGFALRVSPLTMALGTGLLFVAAGWLPGALLGAALVLKIGETGLRYSLDQATRELLYLPVPARTRVKAKAFIDVFMARGAKGLGALLLLPVTFGLVTAIQSGWITLALIAVWLAVTARAYREYVRSFRAGLRDRDLDPTVPINVSDGKTLELLLQALGSSDSRQVLHALEILTAHGRQGLVPPLLLYHDAPEVRRRTLEILDAADRRDASGLVERRLADEDPEVQAEAIRVLARFQGRGVCDLMLPKLAEGEPAIRAAAIACLTLHGDEEAVRRAETALRELLGDADPAARREAAKALGAISEPLFQGHVVQLLYDRDPEVVRAAIAAVERRVARDGFQPIYAPTLVALLQDRRVKHEARSALIAIGEPAVPALCHFLTAPDEPLWVRRALPKTLARIGGVAARGGLLDALEGSDDGFLRRKLIEALAHADGMAGSPDVEERLMGELRREAEAYLRDLSRLEALGLAPSGRLVGPAVAWDPDAAPSLLQTLLAERLDDHLHNLFGLAALRLPAPDVWAAHRAITSRHPATVSRALEYLDNFLSGDLHRSLFAVVGDTPLAERLALARGRGGPRPTQDTTLDELLQTEPVTQRSERRDLALAALYAVYVERRSALYDRVKALMEIDEPAVAETARWVAARLSLGRGVPRADAGGAPGA
jgi:AAA family ATP:ADP antiporter